MKIHNIGYNHNHTSDFKIERPFGSNDYLLLLIKTPASFMIDSVDYRTVPNSFILYNKGTPQYYSAYNTIYTDDWIHFDMTEEDLSQLKHYKIPFDTIVSLNNINELSRFIMNIAYERYSTDPYQKEVIELYFKLLVIKLSERLYANSNEKKSAYYEELSIIRSKIYNTPNYEWNITDLARQLSISKSYFQHLYKLTFDTSVIDDVIQSRIGYAKYLLNSTSLSVKEISAKCGYNNESYFMRQFKKIVGATPSKYRAYPTP